MELRSGKIINVSETNWLKSKRWQQNLSDHSEEYIVKRNTLQKWRLFNAEMSLHNDDSIPDNKSDIDIDFDNASKKWKKNKIEYNDATYLYKHYGGMEGLLNWLYNFFR